ncbi:MAG: paraquat-inducible protein A [Bdellovibrionota bacterium]
MRHFKLILSILLFSVTVWLTYEIISVSKENQINKQDYAEINNIKYGLFSINSWKDQLAAIISAEISNFDLTRRNEKQLKQLIESQLNILIDKVSEKIKQKNSEAGAKGKIKQALINSFVDIDAIKEGIPEYADAMMAEMKKTNTERKLKSVVKSKVDQYFRKTFEAEDVTQFDRIIVRVGATDMEGARRNLDQNIADAEKLLYMQAWALIACAVALFLLAGVRRRPLSRFYFIILLLTLFLLLITGVTTPMIDLIAKISEMSFTLMDHPISFLNQVLYFQSKSIIDVFLIMILHPDIQMKVVGILLVAFSIVFPLCKMLSSMIYHYNYREMRNNKFVTFFVLKSGKWSMTDVLVVAIFMAYIGFNGIITNQFGKLKMVESDVTLLTTNGTSLQPGFYIFLTYAILALFLSSFLMRKPSENEDPDNASVPHSKP